MPAIGVLVLALVFVIAVAVLFGRQPALIVALVLLVLWIITHIE